MPKIRITIEPGSTLNSPKSDFIINGFLFSDKRPQPMQKIRVYVDGYESMCLYQGYRVYAERYGDGWYVDNKLWDVSKNQLCDMCLDNVMWSPVKETAE